MELTGQAPTDGKNLNIANDSNAQITQISLSEICSSAEY